MSSHFDCKPFVLITDSSDDAAKSLTDQQLKILSERGCETIQTMDCSSENAQYEICVKGISSFPTMCSTSTQKCIGGVNENDKHFEELNALLWRILLCAFALCSKPYLNKNSMDAKKLIARSTLFSIFWDYDSSLNTHDGAQNNYIASTTALLS